MNEAKIRELISEMVRLLITYEIELTAYQTVYEAVSKKVEDAGLTARVRVSTLVDWHEIKNCSRFSSSRKRSSCHFTFAVADSRASTARIYRSLSLIT